MNNEALILETMLEIKSQLGEVHATTQGLAEKLTQHVEDDEVTAERVRALELSQAKQRGAIKVWSLVGTGAAGVIGFLASLLTGR